MIHRFFRFALLLCVAATAGADDSFKVVSYNIRYAAPSDGEDFWPNRAATVADAIDQHDIAGLQEVTYPQLQDLQQRLTDFETYSVGRKDGKTDGEHSTVLFRRDRFEAMDHGTFWLSKTPKQPGSKSWDAAIMRICSWVVFRDKQTDRKFLFANTHFDHRGSKARFESGKLIKKTIEETFANLPVILTGDFNCLPGSEPYNAIIAKGKNSFVDVRTTSKSPPAGPNSTWSGFTKIAPGRIIDHVFVAGKMEVQSVTVLNPKTDKDRFASDHLPVQVVALLE